MKTLALLLLAFAGFSAHAADPYFACDIGSQGVKSAAFSVDPAQPGQAIALVTLENGRTLELHDQVSQMDIQLNSIKLGEILPGKSVSLELEPDYWVMSVYKTGCKGELDCVQPSLIVCAPVM